MRRKEVKPYKNLWLKAKRKSTTRMKKKLIQFAKLMVSLKREKDLMELNLS
jgi:hypothetical protein